MKKSTKDTGSKQKVLFIRVDEPVYKAVAVLADEQERSINWMTTKLLKEALEQNEVKV